MPPLPKLWSLCLLLLLAGCLTEVDPRDVDFEPVLVVQSFPQPGQPVTVQLTRTTPLWDPSQYRVLHTSPTDSFYVWDQTPDFVAGAEVRLRVNDETDYLLREDSTGYYSLPLATYQPAPQDHLHLTIMTDQQSVQTETVLPQPLRDYTFSFEAMPLVVDTAVTRTGPNTSGTVYFYYQQVVTQVSFTDPANQSDFYLFHLKQISSRPPPGPDRFSQCSGSPFSGDESLYSLRNDAKKQDERFTAQEGWRVNARFQASLFPDAEDRVATCLLRATLVQYGPEYDRFLKIDYQPASSETGSNIQGGLGLFTGIVIHDTTFTLMLGAKDAIKSACCCKKPSSHVGLF
ncbi:MAG TPA: DUF4249 domain-containing protein, partial [Rhodothermales bacterium]|nr:DUF4249 domain-containing protein [Rhodothermales bacterium]